MSANTTVAPVETIPSQVVPMQVTPNKGFDEIDKEQLLRDALAERKARVEIEQRFQQAMAENLDYQNKLKMEQETRRNSIARDLDAIIQTSLKFMGTEANEQITKRLEPLKRCQDVEALHSAAELLSGLVSASTEQASKVAQLQRELTTAKQNALYSAYAGLGPSKFSQVETRFTQPPDVKMPQSMPVQQPQPVQSLAPQVQLTPSWSPMSTFNPFFHQRSTQVSANIQSVVPGGLSSLMTQQHQQPQQVQQAPSNEPKTFSLDGMVMYHQNNNGSGSYNDIHRSLSQGH